VRGAKVQNKVTASAKVVRSAARAGVSKGESRLTTRGISPSSFSWRSSGTGGILHGNRSLSCARRQQDIPGAIPFTGGGWKTVWTTRELRQRALKQAAHVLSHHTIYFLPLETLLSAVGCLLLHHPDLQANVASPLTVVLVVGVTGEKAAAVAAVTIAVTPAAAQASELGEVRARPEPFLVLAVERGNNCHAGRRRYLKDVRSVSFLETLSIQRPVTRRRDVRQALRREERLSDVVRRLQAFFAIAFSSGAEGGAFNFWFSHKRNCPKSLLRRKPTKC
jgi:hypothetical protein